MLECSTIMFSADYIYVPMYVWSDIYIYVPKQYNFAVSSYHHYCNYLLLSASLHRTVQCSELFDCAVLSTVTAVQHSGYCDVVNWIQRTVLHLTCHGQLKALTVVIKCRPFVFVEKKCDGAVTTVCLFVCLYLTNPLCLQILYRCR